MKRETVVTIGGLNAVLAALRSRADFCRQLLVAESRRQTDALDQILTLARSLGRSVKFVPRPILDRLYGRGRHQGVVAIFDAVRSQIFEDFLQTLPEAGSVLLLALDQVEDPGNLGALMRSALIFGAAGVIAPRDRTAPLTPAALKAAAGAVEFLSLARAVNFQRALKALQKRGFWLVGAQSEGRETLWNFSFPDRSVIILGSEGRGLSPLVAHTCDFLLTIPQKRREVSSLNVSVAGGVLMGEYFRQKLASGLKLVGGVETPASGPEESLIKRQGVTIGHAGDEVADGLSSGGECDFGAGVILKQ